MSRARSLMMTSQSISVGGSEAGSSTECLHFRFFFFFAQLFYFPLFLKFFFLFHPDIAHNFLCMFQNTIPSGLIVIFINTFNAICFFFFVILLFIYNYLFVLYFTRQLGRVHSLLVS